MKYITTVATENYSDYLFCFLKSFSEKVNDEFTIIIINNGFSDDFKKEIKKNENDILNIDFYHIKDNKYYSLFKGFFSRPVYWRLVSADITKNLTDKVLYIDADVIIRKNISDIFDFNLGDNIVGACVDYLDKIKKAVNNYQELELDGEEEYFNAGLLLIDIKKYLNNNTSEKVFNTVLKNKNNLIAQDKWVQDDQYGLNVVLYKNWYKLPICFNYGSELNFDDKAKIVHFIGNGKPGSRTCMKEFTEEFEFYLHNKI